MREMKDSGIEWIGEIPKEWKLCRVKNELDNLDYLREPISAEKRNNYFKLYDYYGASGVIDKIDDYNIDDTVLLIGEDGANLKMRNLPLIYKASGKFWVNNHAHILKVHIDNDYNYFAYLLETGDYSVYITGSAQPKLSQLNLMNFSIVRPPLSEQQAIANYLDAKCSKVDEIIAKIKTTIDEYKKLKQSVITEAVTKGIRPDREMKDSGIEWIGKIPREWKISKLKYIVGNLVKGNGITKEDVLENGDTPCIRYGEIYSKYNNSFSECISRTNVDMIEVKQYIYNGDILFVCTGELVEEIGKNIVYLGAEHCLCGGDIIIARNNVNHNSAFLNYALNSNCSQAQKSRGKTKLKVVHISATEISNIVIAYPNKIEQDEIVDYLDKKCAEIDAVIAKKEQLITELESYKKSLIYEVVTGKKEV